MVIGVSDTKAYRLIRDQVSSETLVMVPDSSSGPLRGITEDDMPVMVTWSGS